MVVARQAATRHSAPWRQRGVAWLLVACLGGMLAWVPPLLAQEPEMLLFVLQDGSLVRGELRDHLASGYLVQTADGERVLPYSTVRAVTALPKSVPDGNRPPLQPPRPAQPFGTAPPTIPAPPPPARQAEPAPPPIAQPLAQEVPMPTTPPVAAPAAATKKAPVRRPTRVASHIDIDAMPDVPGRGLQTFGWVLFGTGATIFLLSEAATSGDQGNCGFCMFNGVAAAAGLGFAILGHVRRARGQEELRDWQRAHGRPVMDAGQALLSAQPIETTMVLVPFAGPSGAAGLALSGRF